MAPAKRAEAALQKALAHTLPDGTPAHSFRTRLEDLGAMVRNTCVTRSAKTASPAFPMVTTANATQRRALRLLQRITASPGRQHLKRTQFADSPGNCARASGELKTGGVAATTQRRSMWHRVDVYPTRCGLEASGALCFAINASRY